MSKLRILLADDHKMLRDGLKLVIGGRDDMEIVGEASNGVEAVQRTRELRPDVVVMDLSMPGLNGLQAIASIKAEMPEMKVLVLTSHEDEVYLRQVCQAKAGGFVLKRSASAELIQAIRKVAEGGIHVDAALAAKALAGPSRDLTAEAEHQHGELSEREEKVLRGIAWGHTTKEIGAELNISSKTVETYKTRVAEKLGLRSRVEMVRFAAARGWLSGDRSFMQTGSKRLSRGSSQG